MNPPQKKKNCCQIKILELKHEEDTAQKVVKSLCNANFNKIQISSATDKEQQI